MPVRCRPLEAAHGAAGTHPRCVSKRRHRVSEACVDGTAVAYGGARLGRRAPPRSEEGATDFDEIARQAEKMVAAGEQADTEAVQKLARTQNISPEFAEYLMALEVRTRKLGGI